MRISRMKKNGQQLLIDIKKNFSPEHDDKLLAYINTNMKTKQAAISLAKNRVSGMYPVGHDWKYTRWCSEFAAWSESTAMDYFKSRMHMAQERINIARKELGMSERTYYGGSWETYV